MTQESSQLTYDAFRDPIRQRLYRADRRRVIITAAVGILAATGLGWANAVTEGSLGQRMFVWVLIPVLLLVTTGRLLFLKGIKDSLRVYRGSIELPERSFHQAVLGRQNPVVRVDRIQMVHVPPDPHFPFIGFVTQEGRVHLVDKRTVGDLEPLREVLKSLGLKVIADLPPPKTDWVVPAVFRLWPSKRNR